MSNERFAPCVEGIDSSRRQFLGGTLGVLASSPWLGAAVSLAAEEARPAAPKRKLKLGLVGCGGRGSWLGKIFQEHGGYELHAIADYFPETAEAYGNAAGVDKSRRFSGLSGYKKVIESGIEAIVLQTPPCFFQEHASAAAEAGLHVYMAKPVAVDVPGCLRIEAAGKQATEKKRFFFVDYQMPGDPVNVQVAEMIHKEGFAKLARVVTVGVTGGHPDQPKTATVESRLKDNTWDNDIAISGGWINVFDIHALDMAIWVLGRRPVAAMGASRIARSNPHGDSHDICSVIYDYADGLFHEHSGLALPNAVTGELSCTLEGETWHAVLNYWRKSRFNRRGDKPFSAEVVDLYPAGMRRNVAAFYEAVTAERFDNPTVRRAVDGCLTCILGREAAARHARMTMDELLKENKRIELDLTGLKA
jgi:predicted dehydrogenase